jgi:predicted transcriptional regulator
LSNRQKNAIVTECNISDLVRGKCMFNRVEDIAKAVEASDWICKERGYEIIELDNRLSKKETMDVVLKIRIKEAVCEFQLAMKQDESRYHFIHSIY